MFVARPPAGPPLCRDLHLVRAERSAFAAPAGLLADPESRARVAEYLGDMTRSYGREMNEVHFREAPLSVLGHSYGEMAQALIGPAVSADEPVDLLILAFSIHDLRPERQTAAYLSHLTPGAPMAFAICDQGSAAAFSGLRIAHAYVSSAGIKRALIVVVEQAALPYSCPVPLPSQHRGVAMLYGDGPGGASARVADVRQHPGIPPSGVACLAAAYLSELVASNQEVRLVLSDTVAAVWTPPDATRVRVMPAGQPSTGVWWGLIDELTGDAAGAGGSGGSPPGGQCAGPDLVLAADYDPDLRYLCLAAFERVPPQPHPEPHHGAHDAAGKTPTTAPWRP